MAANDSGGPWPGGAGVGGVSEAAARGGDRHAAVTAVHAWLAACRGPAGPAEVARFPFAPVLRRYRAVGRAYAGDELVTLLRTVHSRLPGDGRARLAWPLPEWLPSTADQTGGGYDGYLAAPLLDSPAGADLPAHRAAADLLAALAADLLELEVRALGRRPGRVPRQRARACLGVLARLRDDAVPPPSADEELADLAGAWIAETGETIAPRVRVVTELSLLPMTPLHDELMFIRCLQLFETLYRRIGDALEAARDALVRLAVERARVLVADAARLLALSPPLYRVVTTMPPAAFAVIRAHTDGRSAIQSRGFRRVEALCAGTLQEAVLRAGDRLGGVATARVCAELGRLDEAWCAMKRTHWGITLKIIGTVPGTGGTTGAEYLRRAAGVPLFPALAARPVEVPA
ncbi:hypothetical protein [Amycolatopsis sp. CA-128772]|uniref:hypothetical protein n=1 Tax=Amycolatopsis sp. CA-128772 TaxID=2073159 RepID=UPI0011AFF0C8|nr:hypothetical protein [Amycolatopsis sp. CA-128772]